MINAQNGVGINRNDSLVASKGVDLAVNQGIASAKYCDENGDNCFVSTDVGGGGSSHSHDGDGLYSFIGGVS